MVRGYTQAQLSRMLGISASAVGMYERNMRQPSTELLIQLSDIFSVSVDYLLGRENTPESVEEVLQNIYKSLSLSKSLTYNGVEFSKSDIKKLFWGIKIVAEVIYNEKFRNWED